VRALVTFIRKVLLPAPPPTACRAGKLSHKSPWRSRQADIIADTYLMIPLRGHSCVPRRSDVSSHRQITRTDAGETWIMQAATRNIGGMSIRGVLMKVNIMRLQKCAARIYSRNLLRPSEKNVSSEFVKENPCNYERTQEECWIQRIQRMKSDDTKLQEFLYFRNVKRR
jgi:hypothetical protein